MSGVVDTSRHLGVFLSLLALLALCACGAVAADETAAGTAVENVDQGQTFDSIQAAVDNASAGDTIEVEAGTFTESVTIDTQGLTLTAAAGADPVVVGQSARAVNIDADSVTVSNLTIRNPTGAGDGNTSRNAVGIRIDDNSTGVTVENNTITDIGVDVNTNTRGIIVFSGADDTAILNNEISNINGTTDDEDRSHAIQFFESAGPDSALTGVTVVGNSIDGVFDQRSAAGVHLNGNITATIADNEIRNLGFDDTGFTDGIFLGAGGAASSPPDDVVITDNRLENIAGTGVRAIAISGAQPRGPENFEVTRNTIDSLDGATEIRGVLAEAAMFVGPYGTLGATHNFTQNNVLDGSVVRSAPRNNPAEFINDSATDTLNATGNWWGNETGPSGAGPGSGQPVIPGPERIDIQDPQDAVEFEPFRELPALDLNNNENVANDSDNDGKLEDANGDGTLDVLDAQTLFDRLDTASVQDNTPSFDFLEDDEVNILDVQALFVESQN